MISPTTQHNMRTQQSVAFSSSTHGHDMAQGGQHGVVDIALVVLGVVIVVLVCAYTLKYLIKPREKDPNHIKRRVLRDDPPDKDSRSQNGR